MRARAGTPGHRSARVLALGKVERCKYERRLKRDRERLRALYVERRSAVAASQGWRCAECSASVGPGEYDLDHVDASQKSLKAHQPHRSGWGAERDNLQALCLPCHVSKTRVDRWRRIGRIVERGAEPPAPF